MVTELQGCERGMKWANLEKRSTTTNKTDLPFTLGKPSTKSIDISTQCDCGTGNGAYKLCGCTLDLACKHVIQLAQYLDTLDFILGQKKCSCKTSNVLAMLKYPIKPPSCASLNNNKRKNIQAYKVALNEINTHYIYKIC